MKICGLTRPGDIAAAVQAGADALGFVFAPRSPRKLEPAQAAALVADIPPFVTCVGLFQDQAPDEVAEVLDAVPLGMLQFHGSEPAEYCRRFGVPYMKAVSMMDNDALKRSERSYDDAAALLLDSHQPGEPGGTGTAFDWSLISASAMSIVVAGGLTPENVCRAVRELRPWAVDVSSGVESEPGIKDRTKIETFIEEVQRGDRTQS